MGPCRAEGRVRIRMQFLHTGYYGRVATNTLIQIWTGQMLFSDQRTLAGKTHMGRFTIGTNQVLVGELKMEQPRYPVLTLLNEGQSQWKEVPTIPPTITGQLTDNAKVTLLGCNIEHSEHPFTEMGILQRQAVTVKPDFVMGGNQHLDAEQDNLTKVEFTVDDSCCLRWRHTFQGLSPDTPETETIPLEWNREGVLFQADTVFGQIAAQYSWQVSMIRAIPPFSPDFRIHGNIIISIDSLPKALSLAAVRESTRKLLYFLGMVAGYPIEIVQMAVSQASNPTSRLEVFPLPYYLPVYETVQRSDDMEPIVTDGEAMACLLTQWIAQGEEVQNKKKSTSRWEARKRYYTSCLLKGHVFDEDRLVAAANLFDLLPEAAVHTEFQLDDEYDMAVNEALCVFERLPKSEDRYKTRQRGLSALKRLGKPTLKNKIQARAQIVMDPLKPQLNHLCQASDLAVDLRNHYVHGSKFKREITLERLIFLTMTLEFAFIVSELIEAGWDIQGFLQRPVFQHFVKKYLNIYPVHISDIAK